VREEIYNTKESTFIRVTKSEAKKMYNRGERIVLAPVNCNLNSPWASPLIFTNKGGEPFNEVVLNYEFSNCNRQMGMYTKFFKEVRSSGN
jgi:hypothetical protein